MIEPPAVVGTLRSFVVQYATWLNKESGSRRFVWATIFGVVATFSLPPLNIWPVLYVVFPSLLWLLSGIHNRISSFVLGWWFGFGFFGSSLYWIGNALLIKPDVYGWLIPFASLGLPAVFAVYSGLVSLAASYGRNHLQRGLLFAAAWVLTEWLRGHILTGFPWNLIGYSWGKPESLIQIAAWIGIYGVSLVVILSAVLPVSLADSSSRRALITLILSLSLPLAAWMGGIIRLSGAPELQSNMVKGVGIRIVQPSIPQNEKWVKKLHQRNMNRYLHMSLKNRPSWITHIVWPETAASLFVEEDELMRGKMALTVPEGGLLLTGAPRRQGEPRKLWNSLLAVDGSGTVVASYDKSHLVPFGEYIPFRNFLPLEKIVPGQFDYTPGIGVQTIQFPGLPPVSVLICYEIIFSGRVIDRNHPADWLLNITNDAWFGTTAGPHQHLAIARVRAVEEGRPLIRATNTGISAVIDAYGRTVFALGLNRVGVIDSQLPNAISEKTVFARGGHLIIYVLLIGVLLLVPLAKNRT